ncbi:MULTISPECIES: cell division protein PerM [Dietzia]|uniref:DUF6350 family protein n=1 Tax=Dietzia maris TaxID=37915 RepID=A0ABT8H1Q5_9ACTN|nr:MULTISPECIES: DUF6350 family protein [Dietzia]MCY1657627.1 DUF6350 family protein [Dietzia sp. SL131]MCZ4541516.1 DUF6350 family protein [Dietzia maris]MCZ4655919.1 DUF6350 family protein [Dietzia kunjamensis]MDJ0422477.1 DUF6350 family protein [Dietzia kunjamensis]MDN4506392.1 DUF6350 family protein [Dietzia maris]
MSPPRVIRPAARRSPAGARSLLWTAAAAALPVIVSVLVLAALTLAVLLFTADGFDSLFAVVAVEWLVVNRVPLTVDRVELGFLPLLPALIYVAVLARQTRAVLADVEQPGPREAGAAMAGVTLAGLLLTGLATLLVGSAASDFAVRESALPTALLWTAGVGIVGSGLGVWLYFRRDLREILPLWVRGGIHLGAAFVAATWAVATLLVLVGLVMAWEPVGSVLEIGKGVVGAAALAGISVAYLPNVVMTGAALMVGGEAHLGEASYSVFAVSRGPMPEVPLAAVLPTTNPHWVVQGLLLVTVFVAAGLARSVAHWFRTTGDAVKATWLAAGIVALVIAVSPVIAGGRLGMLGMVGTGSLIAASMALVLFGIIGSATIALSLAGLTRRRERAESELERRRRRAGTAPVVEDPVEDPAEYPVEDPTGSGVGEVGEASTSGVEDAGVEDAGVDSAGVDDEVAASDTAAEAEVDAQPDLDPAADEDATVAGGPPSPAVVEDPRPAEEQPAEGQPAEDQSEEVRVDEGESEDTRRGDAVADDAEPGDAQSDSDDPTGLPAEGRGAAD